MGQNASAKMTFFFVRLIWLHHCVGHTAWAPEGREGRSQAGPNGRNLEVGPQRGPRLLVPYMLLLSKSINNSKIDK